MAKKNNKKKVVRKTSVPRNLTPIDGQNLIINGYFEVTKALTNTSGLMAYTIQIDPKNCKIAKGAGATETFLKGTDDTEQLVNSNLDFQKFTNFSANYNQYRVNSCQVVVRVDPKCGLDHALVMSNDKGNDAVVTNMASSISGAHKSFSMTASRREATYKTKNYGQDKDFLSCNPSEATKPEEIRYIKVFQKLPKYETAGDMCEHQVQVMMSITLKDSKNLN